MDWLCIPSPGGAYRKKFRQYSQRTHNMGHVTVCVITYSSISDPELTKRSRLQVPIKWPRVLNTLIQVNFFKCYNNKVSIDSGISASSHDETRTRFILLPQKITRLDNIYEKSLFRHRTAGNAREQSLGAGKQTSEPYTENTHCLEGFQLTAWGRRSQTGCNNSPALQETVQSSRTPRWIVSAR